MTTAREAAWHEWLNDIAERGLPNDFTAPSGHFNAGWAACEEHYRPAITYALSLLEQLHTDTHTGLASLRAAHADLTSEDS